MNKALKKAGIAEKYFDTGEIKLNYVAGPPNGPPIVFIPGQTVTWEEYTLILPMLAPRFQVFAVSVRGHGKSTWTPGNYTFNALGKDMTSFLREVVRKPAIVGGNSSGGVLTCWLAANSPEWVKAAVCEDPPLFRSEWPRIKTTTVWDIFKLMVKTMGTSGGGGFPKFFRDSYAGMVTTAKTKDVLDMKLPPKFAVDLISRIVALQLAIRPGSAVDLKFLPFGPRTMLKGISQFDASFAQAFAEGTMGEGFDHASALAKIKQPMLLLHANWFMDEGRLTGALDDNDVARVKSLVKGQFKYVRLNCGHGIPMEAPDQEAEEIISWVDEFVK